jgi:hypothetical protein
MLNRYSISNNKVYSHRTAQNEYVGATHRYLFTSNHGIRIMAFGVLISLAGTRRGSPTPEFSTKGNTTAAQVIKAIDMVKKQ